MTTEIRQLWDAERALLDELNRTPDPLERAPSVAAGLEAIARREQATRELEATRAARRHLEAEQRAAEVRASEVATWRERVERYETELPAAIAADRRDGSSRPHPSREEALRENLAFARRKLAEAEGATA